METLRSFYTNRANFSQVLYRTYFVPKPALPGAQEGGDTAQLLHKQGKLLPGTVPYFFPEPALPGAQESGDTAQLLHKQGKLLPGTVPYFVPKPALPGAQESGDTAQLLCQQGKLLPGTVPTVCCPYSLNPDPDSSF